MARRLISSGSKFESEIGYSRAVVDDDWYSSLVLPVSTTLEWKSNLVFKLNANRRSKT
jgi:hypothetical protein